MSIFDEIGGVAAQAKQSAPAEVPAIVAPGPWIAFTALGLGLAVDHLHAIRILPHVPALLRNSAAAALVLIGAWCIYRANLVFHRARTPFQPWRPTRTIAAQDIYGCTRNPMYQGFLLLVLGIAVLVRSDGTVLMLMPAAALIHFGVILREENYLLQRFRGSYRIYMSAVPRYGWPFRFTG